MSEDDNLSDKDDRLIQRYDTILKESALLTTFSAILFGFLLNISVNTPRNFSLIDIIVTIIALYSITIARVAICHACNLSSCTISLWKLEQIQN